MLPLVRPATIAPPVIAPDDASDDYDEVSIVHGTPETRDVETNPDRTAERPREDGPPANQFFFLGPDVP
jgi:hypothetical protein